MQLNKQDIKEKAISGLSNKLEIEDLKPGKKKFFCERGWLNNEKDLDYSWMINISKPPLGSCWIFTVKYKETVSKSYSEGFNNKEEYIQGIFTTSDDGTIKDLKKLDKPKEFKDKIKDHTPIGFISTDLEFTLDKAEYKYLIFSGNIGDRTSLNHLRVKEWKVWENEILVIGRRLVKRLKMDELKSLFE